MKQISIVILLVLCLPVWSQQDRIDSLLNDLLYNENQPLVYLETPAHYNFLYIGSTLNNSTFYAGREIGNNKLNVSCNVFYYNSKGFFIGSAGNWYSQQAPGYSSTTLTAGYYKQINKKKTLNFRTSYSRFLYYQPDTLYTYPYKNSLNAGLTFRKKWFGARLSSSFLFGDEFGANATSSLYSRIGILKFGKQNKIYTMPEISVFIGPESIIEENFSATDSTSTAELKKVYNLLNTQLYLPVNISLGDFDIELACAINFPFTQEANTSYPVSANLSVTVGYFLPFF